MVSIDYWVEHQGRRSSVPDTSREVPVIKSDQAGQPGDEFGGNGLYSVYVSERAFAPYLWYVSRVDHVYCFDFWWEFFSVPQCSAGEAHPCLRLVSPCVRRLACRTA